MVTGLAARVGLSPHLAHASSLLGVTGVPVSRDDALVAPAGYVAEVLYAWGDPVSDGAPFEADASNTAAEQAQQAGMHHDVWIDGRGVLWIQTDVSTSSLGKGDYARLGNNMMPAADPTTGDTCRFLTGPNGCEITGMVTTPDGTSMFVDIQPPGEPSSERSDPARPTAVSAWPDRARGGRLRSATVVIRRRDGGVIGT